MANDSTSKRTLYEVLDTSFGNANMLTFYSPLMHVSYNVSDGIQLSDTCIFMESSLKCAFVSAANAGFAIESTSIVNERMHHNIAAYHTVVGQSSIRILCQCCLLPSGICYAPFEPNHSHDYPEHLASTFI